MPTLMTDPRSGGVKKSSGVQVLPDVAEAWAEVRDDTNSSVNWVIVGYAGNSKADITTLAKGGGGVLKCSQALPEGTASFGGCRLSSGRFVSFFYTASTTPIMTKGRASMHKNGVLNTFEGCDREIEMKPGLTDEESFLEAEGNDDGAPLPPKTTPTPKVSKATASTSHVTTPITHKSTVQSNQNEGSVDAQVDAFRAIQIAAGDAVPYSILKDVKDVSALPAGVDPARREMALSDDEFHSIFDMDKASFMTLPAWKRNSKKKEKGLF